MESENKMKAEMKQHIFTNTILKTFLVFPNYKLEPV